MMTLVAIGLAVFLPILDNLIGLGPTNKSVVFVTGSVEGARAVLSTIAGSMITVAGVVFSVTIVALSLASSQFGPRLLRNFMRDTANQLVLGSFIATFVYCLTVLKTVSASDKAQFIPHISVTMGLVLSILSIGLLIYFIHHIAVSIQADHVIASVMDELYATIHRMFPEKIGEDETNESRSGSHEPDQIPDNFDRGGVQVKTQSTGYLRRVDGDLLISLATDRDWVVRLEGRPGVFMTEGSTLAHIWPEERVTDALSEQVRSAFFQGPTRTPIQDVEFAVEQIVEIAVRALSPGINDPFTAITCIDQLSAGLCHCAKRKFPLKYRHDEKKRLRIVAEPENFESIVNVAFNQIRQHSRGNTAVVIRLLESIERILPFLCRLEDVETLNRQANMIVGNITKTIPTEADRDDIQEQYSRLTEAITDARKKLAA